MIRILTSLFLLAQASAFVVRPHHHASTASATSLNMATWSDSKAVVEYQTFLSTGKSEPDKASDCASVIIMEAERECELAEALFSMGMGDDLVMAPYTPLPAEMDGNPSYPIYVTLPPWQLAEFLQNLPPDYMERAQDFVFFSGGLQYGNIEDVLKAYGFCRDTMTQVLISGMKWTQYKQVEDKSVNLGLAGNGEEKFAGQCTACGKWHGAIAERLFRSNVSCRTDFYREWRRCMWEQSIADAVFHLFGAVRSEPTNVQTVALYYSAEVSEALWEISQQLRGWRAVTLLFGFEERMYGAAEQDDTPCTVNNEMFPFIWGHHVFLQSNMFCEYLNYAQTELGLLPGIELPKADYEKVSKMRQGNLRADGVV